MDKIKIYNKPDLKNTISSHTNDIDIPNNHTINKRHEQIKFTGTDKKGPTVSLEDNSDALLTYFNDVISPYITINQNENLKVPVLWMNREKWTEHNEFGYLRDDKHKLQCPLIAIRKTDIQVRDEMRKPNVLRESETMWTTNSSYDKNNTYNRYSVLNNTKRQKTQYKIVFPDYVYITYNVFIWTDMESQLDEIVQKLLSYNRLAFGDEHYYKFTSKFSPFMYDTVNPVNTERKVTANCNLTLDGYIIQDEYWYNNNNTKFIQPEQIVINQS